MIRAFIAIRVDHPAAREELLQKRQGLYEALPGNILRGVRWEDAGYHITLKFLGPLTPFQVQDVQRQPGPLKPAPHKPSRMKRFTLEIEDVAMFSPSILYARVSRHSRVQVARTHWWAHLIATGLSINARDDVFNPHITLARFPSLGVPASELIAVAAAISALEPRPPVEFEVSAISLMESVRVVSMFGDNVVEYRELSNWPLEAL